MANPSGRAGRTWENRVRDYMSDIWLGAERRRLTGRFDKGDLINTGDWAVECKNRKIIDWSGALKEAEQEQKHLGAMWHVAIINRRNHSIDKAYALMTFQQYRELLIYIADLEELAHDPDSAA